MEQKDKGEPMMQPIDCDTTLGQLFVKDQLTGMGIRKNDSASKLSALMGQPTGPDAKFDQQTGKYYKSFTIPSSRFDNVNVMSLLQVFSQPGLCYDHGSHTGAIVSLASGGEGGNVHVTVVGESHVEANALYNTARVRVEVFLSQTEQGASSTDEAGAECVGGMTLVNKSSGNQEKIEALVAENVAGMSLFGNAGKVQDTMTMDMCAGFSLLSFAPEDDSSKEDDEEVCEAEKETPAECVGGMTLMNASSGSQEQIEALVAENVAGVSLFGNAGKVQDTMTMDMCAGFSLLSFAPEDDSTKEEVICEAEKETAAVQCAEAAGVTLFSESSGTAPRIEALVAEHCSGISLFSCAEKPRDVMTADFVGGMTLLSHAEDELSDGDTAAASDCDLDDEEPLNDKDVLNLWNVMTNCAGLTLFGHKREEVPVFLHETV